MSVSKMKDGKRWKVFVRYKDYAGTVKQHKKEGFTRKADAQRYEQTFLERVQGSPSMSLESLYTLYMDDCKIRLRETTVALKETIFTTHILPDLAEMVISDITTATVRNWQNQLLKKISNRPPLNTSTPNYLRF